MGGPSIPMDSRERNALRFIDTGFRPGWHREFRKRFVVVLLRRG